MVRLRNILPAGLTGCVMIAAATLVACGDDELTGYVPETATVDIVQNNLIFTAASSSATVTVGGDNAIETELNASWCSATVNGRTVTVSVEPNRSFEGRTALLTIKTGSASRQLPVQQKGMVLDLPLASNGHHSPIEGDVFTIPVQHDLPLELSTNQSWIHPVATDSELRITVDDNTGGHIRRGTVVCSCGEFSDTVRIAQFDMTNDVVGSYYMMGYYGGNHDTPSAVRFDIIQRNDSLLLNWPTQRYEKTYTHIPFDETTCTLIIPSNFQLYNDGRTTDTAYFYDSNGVVCTQSGSGASARLVYYEDSDANIAGLYAYNWPGHTLEGFIIRSVSLAPTILLQLSSPILMRVGPPGTTLSSESKMNKLFNE